MEPVIRMGDMKRRTWPQGGRGSRLALGCREKYRRGYKVGIRNGGLTSEENQHSSWSLEGHSCAVGGVAATVGMVGPVQQENIRCMNERGRSANEIWRNPT